MAKILIIEDSITVRVFLKNILIPIGHEVIEAVSGEDALDKLNDSTNFDIILCDINMPDMDGITFVKHQRDHKIYCNIPTIMVTTESDPKLANEAKKIGVIKAWITKPVKPEVLIKFIDRLTKNKEK